MTVETFFEKFELFADVPGAVGKMRELVLELAVQGKLVEQEEGDEPASFLLKKTGDKLPSEKRRRRPESLGAVDNPPFKIPATWQWAHFQDVALIASNLVNPKGLEDLMHLAPDNIEKATGRLLPCRTVGEDKVRSGNHRFFAGQLVYSKIRPNLSKVVVVDFGGLCSADMYPIDPLIDPRYLLRYMLSQRFLAQAVKTDTRVAMPKINQEELNAIAVPVPPLAEQKRIVAKVDELMGLCDRLEAEQKERESKHAALARAALARFAEAPTPENLEYLFHAAYTIDPTEIRKSILAMALRGRLLRQNPDDEPAAITVAKLPPKPRPARYGSRSTANIAGIAALSIGYTRYPIPPGWLCTPLVDVAQLESGHTPSRTRPDWWNGDIPWVGVVDARLHHGGTINATRQHTNEKGLANSAARLLPAGTVCVSRTASVGYVIILGKPMATSQDFVNWVPSQAVTSDWLRLVFTGEEDGFKRFSKGAVHQTIYFPEWLSMHTLLPPLAEQHRIVAKVDALMSLVDRLEAQLTSAREAGKRLVEAVVGELIAPSPSQHGVALLKPEQPITEVRAQAPVKEVLFVPGAIAAYIARKLQGDVNFGRTKLEKVNHFLEYHAGVPLKRKARPYMYGPVDYEQLKKAEEWAAGEGAFATHDAGDNSKVTYRPGPRLKEWADRAADVLGDAKSEADRIIGLLRTETTRRCEIFATVYAAWNDLLLRRRSPSDKDIMDEIRNHWHERKQMFKDKDWRIGLSWLRINGLTPKGTGRLIAGASLFDSH